MKLIARTFAGLFTGLLVASAVAAVLASRRRSQVVRADDPELDEVQLVAIFEPLSFRSRAAAFRGGTLELWFGGGIIDLRDATLDPAGAVLTVRAIFGGCQVVVPESWQVVTRVQGLGGAGDARPAADRAVDGPVLTIEGIAIFGGLGVSSDVSEEAERQLDQAVAGLAAARTAVDDAVASAGAEAGT